MGRRTERMKPGLPPVRRLRWRLLRRLASLRALLRTEEAAARRRGFRWLWLLWGGIALLVLLNGMRLLIGF